MPGIFGAVGCPLDVANALRMAFDAAYGASASVRVGDGILGGHAFGAKSALHRSAHGEDFAVDGDPSIYRLAAQTARGDGPPAYALSAGEIVLPSTCKGNIAVVDPVSGA